ncbi:MAG: hypothetical protein AAF827_03070 [Cyanobacteria bacterium P01_D01_bin.6]
MAETLIQRSRSLLNSELWILHFAIRELRLNNIPPTLLPIHPATVLSGYFIFKPIRNCSDQGEDLCKACVAVVSALDKWRWSNQQQLWAKINDELLAIGMAMGMLRSAKGEFEMMEVD